MAEGKKLTLQQRAALKEALKAKHGTLKRCIKALAEVRRADQQAPLTTALFESVGTQLRRILRNNNKDSRNGVLTDEWKEDLAMVLEVSRAEFERILERATVQSQIAKAPTLSSAISNQLDVQIPWKPVQSGAAKTVPPELPQEDMPADSCQASFREFFSDALYRWNGCSADAIRLAAVVGDEMFPPERVQVMPRETPYVIPGPLSKDRETIIRRFEEHAELNNYDFYDGPCVRLIHYTDGAHDASEDKHLKLKLGPITWYDYVLANQRFGDPGAAGFYTTQEDVTNFVDFALLLKKRCVSASLLSNILTAYVSVTTVDGHIVYTQRSDLISTHREFLMSAVSENIHPQKEDVFGAEGGRALFKTAARGIDEELSPKLRPAEPGSQIRLLGLDFHFHAFHPGLLFFAPLQFTRKEVEEFLRDYPGKSFKERQYKAQCVDLGDVDALRAALLQPNWFSAGKACVIRTLQYLEAIANGKSLSSVAAALAHD